MGQLRQGKACFDQKDPNEHSPLPGSRLWSELQIALIRLSIEERCRFGLGTVRHCFSASCISPDSSTGNGASSARPRG